VKNHSLLSDNFISPLLSKVKGVQIVDGFFYDGWGNTLDIGANLSNSGIGPTGPQGPAGAIFIIVLKSVVP